MSIEGKGFANSVFAHLARASLDHRRSRPHILQARRTTILTAPSFKVRTPQQASKIMSTKKSPHFATLTVAADNPRRAARHGKIEPVSDDVFIVRGKMHSAPGRPLFERLFMYYSRTMTIVRSRDGAKMNYAQLPCVIGTNSPFLITGNLSPIAAERLGNVGAEGAGEVLVS